MAAYAIPLIQVLLIKLSENEDAFFQLQFTVFTPIVVHAPIYETEAMVHAPKVPQKIGPFRI